MIDDAARFAWTPLRATASPRVLVQFGNRTVDAVPKLTDDASDALSVVAPSSEFTGRFARMNPNELRFSQTTAGGNGRAAARRASMIEQGWNGEAVDAVETVDGIVTIDNTRIAIARELGIPQVPVKIRLPSDPLPPSSLGRFGDATTWGEALQYRTSIQRPPLPPTGTPNPPRLPQ